MQSETIQSVGEFLERFGIRGFVVDSNLRSVGTVGSVDELGHVGADEKVQLLQHLPLFVVGEWTHSGTVLCF